MEKNLISFFAINFILLFAVISFILIVFDLHRFAFVFELMLLLIFIFLFTFSMFVISRNKKWGWTVLGATLILMLVNVFFIILLKRTFETTHLTTIVFSTLGLLVALVNLKEPRYEETEAKEEYEKTQEYYPYIDKMEPEREIKKESKIEKTFTPGKFIASKKANKFHSPKCDWAKRISKENQLWFNSKEEAEKQGFTADRCIG